MGGHAGGSASEPQSEATEITYREAVREAIRDALTRDQRVFLMGEDVGRYGGCYAVTKGLLAEFGPERIRDTPLSETGFTGAGIGAAMAGMRPIVELMTVNFSLLALDQILNQRSLVRRPICGTGPMTEGTTSLGLPLRRTMEVAPFPKVNVPRERSGINYCLRCLAARDE